VERSYGSVKVFYIDRERLINDLFVVYKGEKNPLVDEAKSQGIILQVRYEKEPK